MGRAAGTAATGRSGGADRGGGGCGHRGARRRLATFEHGQQYRQLRRRDQRDLVQTDTESGTLGYKDPRTVYNRLSGTITWLPSVGQLIKPGQPLYRIDGAPVILMNGTMPAYRDLSPSDDDGPDITELNRNLVALGFDPESMTIDDVWQAGMTAGVELFQESLGETETGTLSLGQIVFLPGDQLVTAVEGTLGGTGGSTGSGASASDPVAPASPQYVSFEKTTTAGPTEGSAVAGAGSQSSPTVTPASCPTANTSAPKTSSGKAHGNQTCKPRRPKKPKPSVAQRTLAALLALPAERSSTCCMSSRPMAPLWS